MFVIEKKFLFFTFNFNIVKYEQNTYYAIRRYILKLKICFYEELSLFTILRIALILNIF